MEERLSELGTYFLRESNQQSSLYYEWLLEADATTVDLATLHGYTSSVCTRIGYMNELGMQWTYTSKAMLRVLWLDNTYRPSSVTVLNFENMFFRGIVHD